MSTVSKLRYCGGASILALLCVILVSAIVIAQDAGDVRGDPIDAPVDDGSVSDTGGGTGEMIRTIPKESWDLMKKMDQDAGVADGALKFERTEDGKYYKVGFKQLGNYEYEIPEPAKLREAPDPKTVLGDQVPPPIKGLEKKDIMVVGFMVPVKLDQSGNLRSFVLTQDQQLCCYGVVPKINEWIFVEMVEGTTADYQDDLPVAVYGNFEVSEQIEDGYIVSLYRMKATQSIDALQLLRKKDRG